jgi:Fasciclin domain
VISKAQPFLAHSTNIDDLSLNTVGQQEVEKKLRQKKKRRHFVVDSAHEQTDFFSALPHWASCSLPEMRKATDNAQAWSVYNSRREQLGNICFSSFQQHIWPQLAKEMSNQLDAYRRQPYETADKTAALAKHAESQMHIALGAVQELMQNKTLKQCQKLMSDKKSLCVQIEGRCAIPTRYGTAIDVLQALSVAQPEVVFQKHCADICDEISGAWAKFSLKAQTRAFCANDFRNYCIKHLIDKQAGATDLIKTKEKASLIPPLVRSELIKLTPLDVSCHKRNWRSSSSDDEDELYEKQPALRTPPREMQTNDLIKVTPLSSKTEIPQLVPIGNDEMPALVDQPVGHWSIFPPLFPHHHRHHSWYNAQADEAVDDELDIDAGILNRVRTIASILEKDAKGFFSALRNYGLDRELAKRGPYTVFAAKELFRAMTSSEQMLKHHIVAQKVPSSSLRDKQRLRAMDGSDLVVRIRDGKVYVDGQLVVKADVNARNGIIHYIESYMDVESEPVGVDAKLDKVGAKLDKIGERPQLKRIEQASAERVTALLSEYFAKTKLAGSFLLFAPTDQHLEENKLGFLLDINADNFLTNHLYSAKTVQPISKVSPQLLLKSERQALCGQANWRDEVVKLNKFTAPGVSVQIYGMSNIIQPVGK